MEYQLSGAIKVITDTQTFNSGFTKREFVVTTPDDRYPQDIKFEVVKEKCDLLDTYAVGDAINVHFNIRGNEYNGRYYVNLQAWKLEKGEGGAGGDKGKATGGNEEPPPGHGQDQDDIPF